MKVIWTHGAARDRAEQLQYVADENPTAAARLAFAVRDQISLLSQFPEMGRPGRVNGSRELVIQRTPYVVVYRIKDESVQILRLLHGAQKWPSI